AVRDDLLAKYIRQFSLHILEYEARARANLHNKHAEMKAVTAEDINYLVNSFEFHPWDKD
ncbi:MAG: hypothetical protein QW112_02885, partial [Candidatus Micrarchaeia archaeon]